MRVSKPNGPMLARPLRLFFALAVVVVLVATPVIPASPIVYPGPSATLEHLAVGVQIHDVLAVTTLNATYHNPANVTIEERVSFTLDRSAVLTGFQIRVGNETFEGVVKERGAAQETYDEAVKREEIAVLLTSAGGGRLMFTLNLPAYERATIMATFAQVLPLMHGAQHLDIPLDAVAVRHGAIAVLDVVIEARASHGWAESSATGLPFESNTTTNRTASWSFHGEDVAVNDALRVRLVPSLEGYRSSLVVSGFEEDAAGLFTILPPGGGEPPLPLDIVLIMDVSGSMRGVKMTQAKDALHTILDQLRGEDRFALVSFSTDVDVHRDALDHPSGKTLAEARLWIDDLEANGWTNISGSLDVSLNLLRDHAEQEGRVPTIVLVTDGEANRGISVPREIIAAVSEWNDMAARVHTVGIGFSQEYDFLNKLATENRGLYQGMPWEADASVILADFLVRIGSPVLKDLALTFPDLNVTQLHPDPIPDIYSGSRLVVGARLDASGLPHDVVVRLHGTTTQGHKTMNAPIKADAIAVVPEALQLWARQKAISLEHSLSLDPYGENAEATKEALVELGVRYQIETSQTSWVITTEVKEKTPRLPALPALPLPGAPGAGGSSADLATRPPPALGADPTYWHSSPADEAMGTPIPMSDPAETPGPAVAVLLAGVLCILFAMRRRWHA